MLKLITHLSVHKNIILGWQHNYTKTFLLNAALLW